MNLPQNLFDGNVSVQTFLCQPDKTIIGEILPYDFNTTFKFNTYSEISFTIDRYYNDLFDGETKVNPYYDLIESVRVIYLRGIGHFTIQDVSEDLDDKESVSVTCFSLEYTTGQKYLENFYVNTGEEGSVETMYHARQYGAEYSIDNYYTQVTKSVENFDAFERYFIKEYTDNDSYNYVEVQIVDATDFSSYDEELYIKKYPNVRFYWPTCPDLSLLHLIFRLIPEWKIGHVDKELWSQERTFSEDRTAVYDFLYNTAAETLKYVMVWDSINGVVNFYKTEEDGIITSNYVRTNVYNGNFVYYSDTKGTEANPQPTNESEVQKGNYYIDIGKGIETQWDTDVFISRSNLASALNVQCSTDDIKTKLKVSGDSDLDIRDVNLGQNYILNLSYYNTPEWLGEDLHLKYNAYLTDLANYTVQYQKLVSAWAAAYNEYSDLMNYVPVEPRVMLVGDEFEKLYCVYNQYKPALKKYDESLTYFKYDTAKDSSTYLNYVEASPQPVNDQDLKNGQYYVKSNTTIDTLAQNLQTKLERYKVDQGDDGERSTSEKSDDVLLTLENDKSDSVTLRVRYDQNDESSTTYRVYRTLTTAATGIVTTKDFSLAQWVGGEIRSSNLFDAEYGKFKIKSIGTLGAFFCLVRDETEVANVEDYGIKLLETKKATYTKIFLTQTEGYMNSDKSKCVVSNERPTGEIAVGTKWLDSDTVDATNLKMEIYQGNDEWIEYIPAENESDYENYLRFAENYTKLGNVQAVLAEKQRVADYLLNGIPVNAMRLVEDNINLNSLLRAAIIHFIVLDNDYFVANMGDAIPQDIKVGTMWFQTIDNGYSLYSTIKQWNGKSWVEPETEVDKISLTRYDQDNGIATFIVNPNYSGISETDEYSTKKVYFLKKDGEYIKPQIQPSSTDELTKRYECEITNDISKETECFFQIGNQQYTFTATQDIKANSILIYNDSINVLTVGADSFEPERIVGASGMTELKFNRVVYYTIEGTEYAVYVNNGTPYVSYARSQGVCLAKMNALKEASDMSTYFSEQELTRLSPFIREDEFSDSNFLLTSYESEEEQMYIKQELLKAGTEELQKLCQPKLSFDASMSNILSIPEFAPLKTQFKLGNFVRVELRDDYIKRARLLEVQINFDDPSDFNCTFGDLISTKSEIDKHAELLQQAVSAGKSVAANVSKWQKVVDKSTELDQRINEGLQDATLQIGKAEGQSIEIGPYGLYGRKLIDGTTDQYEDEQVALINNKLVFTSDGWKTAKSAFGKFTITDENGNNIDHWGVLADSVISGYIEGSTIRGGSLRIGDGTNNYFQVDPNGDVKIVQGGKDTTSSATALDNAYRYSIELSYSGSTVFTTTTSNVIVTAIVKELGKDITHKIPIGSTFKWFRNDEVYATTTVTSSNKPTTTINTDSTKLTANQINITHAAIDGNAFLSCQVDFDETKIT